MPSTNGDIESRLWAAADQGTVHLVEAIVRIDTRN